MIYFSQLNNEHIKCIFSPRRHFSTLRKDKKLITRDIVKSLISPKIQMVGKTQRRKCPHYLGKGEENNPEQREEKKPKMKYHDFVTCFFNFIGSLARSFLANEAIRERLKIVNYASIM